MTKQFLFFIIILFSFHSFSQKLIYNSNGNIIDAQNNKVSPEQVRAILSNTQQILDNYNVGRNKKTIGNIMLYGGLGFIIGDLFNGLTNDIVYPTALTYIGAASLVISIPVKIGFSNKIKKAVSDYNSKPVGYNQDYKNKMEIISNHNGIGLRLTLN